MSSQNIIKKLKDSGLTGRGGAGFPTGLKWELVKKTLREKKYIICNGSEGEPGTFKDGFILHNYSEELIKGIKVALKTIGHSSAYIYLRKDYYQKFKKGLEKRIEFNNLHIKILVKQGGYICGEETALIESIEGKRPEPRPKPPYPSKKGLWGYPTLINNVETFYSIAQVAQNRYKQTRFYSLTGVKNPGVYELSERLSAKQILKKTNNWPSFDFFVQAGGGASGRILVLKELNQRVGGVGSIIVYNLKKTSPTSLMRKWADFFFKENCGKCVPCREGVYRLRQVLKQKQINQKILGDLLFVLEQTSFCPFGKSICLPFRTLIKKVIRSK